MVGGGTTQHNGGERNSKRISCLFPSGGATRMAAGFLSAHVSASSLTQAVRGKVIREGAFKTSYKNMSG